MRTNQIVTRVPSPQLILHSPPQGFIVFLQDQPPSSPYSLGTGFSDAVSQRKERVSESDKYNIGKTSRKDEGEGKASHADKESAGQSLGDVEEEGWVVRTSGR